MPAAYPKCSIAMVKYLSFMGKPLERHHLVREGRTAPFSATNQSKQVPETRPKAANA